MLCFKIANWGNKKTNDLKWEAMMNIGKRMKAIFANPERKLGMLMPKLREFRKVLWQTSISKDPLTEIVHFFNAVSVWYDRGINDLIVAFEEVNYGQYNGALRKLRLLEKHLENIGQDKDGWNRTKRYDTVTADKIFLGNIFDLYTNPVSFWEQKKNKKKGGWRWPNMDHLNAYDVVSRQAQDFMASHTGPMIAIIDYLEAVAA